MAAAPPSLAKAPAKSPEECLRWMQRVHEVQKSRTPEAWEAAKQRAERTRQYDANLRKCKAVKSHAVRSRALAAEGLRQMSASAAPSDFRSAQERWQASAEASRSCLERSYQQAHAAVSAPAPMGPLAEMDDADEEGEAAMMQCAQLMGGDAARMSAVGSEGLPQSLPAAPAAAASALAPALRLARPGGRGRPAPPPAPAGHGSAVQELLQQLRKEPADEAECTAKFLLYEGYGKEVEQMRGSLLRFHEESRPMVPAAVATAMDKEVAGIDSEQALAIPDEAREWFVFHMMRQAERNNLKMAAVLSDFERRLEFLSSSEQAECPVCLEAFSAAGERAPETLGCCHKVCKECWANWCAVTAGRPFCPLCRHDEFLGAVAARLSADS